VGDEKAVTASDYVGILNDVIALHKNAVVCRHMSRISEVLDSAEYYRTKTFVHEGEEPIFSDPGGAKKGGVYWIDIWLLPAQTDESAAASWAQTNELLLQMAAIIHRAKRWKKRTAIRVLATTHQPEMSDTVHIFTQSLLQDLRVDAKVLDVDLDEDPLATKDYAKYNETLRAHSSNSCLVLLLLPTPPNDPAHARSYVKSLDTLTDGLPPTMMILGNSGVAQKRADGLFRSLVPKGLRRTTLRKPRPYYEDDMSEMSDLSDAEN